jgi:hypothetical protein
MTGPLRGKMDEITGGGAYSNDPEVGLKSNPFMLTVTSTERAVDDAMAMSVRLGETQAMLVLLTKVAGLTPTPSNMH